MFTAAQAAQKAHELAEIVTDPFTAAQAAQKWDGSHEKERREFTAAQAAQKMSLRNIVPPY